MDRPIARRERKWQPPEGRGRGVAVGGVGAQEGKELNAPIADGRGVVVVAKAVVRCHEVGVLEAPTRDAEIQGVVNQERLRTKERRERNEHGPSVAGGAK